MVFRKKPRNIRRKEPAIKRIKHGLKSRNVLRIIKTVAYLSSVLLIIFGAWRLYHELLRIPYLAIKEIRIAGNMRVSKAEVLELAGINLGDNLLKINTGDIQKNLRLNTWIAEVDVARNFPNRLSIGIKERKPVAFINLDSLYFVDETGIIFKKISIEDEIDLPIITGLKMEDIEEEVKTSELAIKAVNLIHVLEKKEIFANNEELSEINIDKAYGLTLYTMQQGTRIELGDEEFTEKIEKLKRVIQSRNGFADIEFIGLNYNKGVVVKLAHREPEQEIGKIKVANRKTST
ncbi:MAG: FtsQ-type POTRA domain-containing protein [Deltaproteobacteria bacterium]|nr:FtsQ-type POTRA domain-containing protein [Deltaproteobacteria bacterium]